MFEVVANFPEPFYLFNDFDVVFFLELRTVYILRLFQFKLVEYKLSYF